MRWAGISPLTAAVHPSYFLKAKLLENILRVFESCHASESIHSLGAYRNKKSIAEAITFYFVRRAGFEPA